MNTALTAPQLFDETPDPRGSFVRDDRGAIMVIGVFMAMLVTGFLYYIVGIGNTLIYRERLQDAADAIAFSGAVIHARGMNLIALINIILLILVTIFIALRMVERTLYYLVVACASALILVCGEAVGALEAADRVMVNIVETYSRTILQPALELGHTAQELIKNTFPALAQGSVIASTLSGAYNPPATSGLLLPLVPYRTLPVAPMPLDNDPRGLNVRAGANIGYAITFPLSFLPFLSAVRGLVSSFVGRFLGTALGPPDRPSWRNYDMDYGSGDCSDGMPGQDCEYVQLRGVALASRTPFENNARGVNVANFGRATGGGAFSAFEEFTHVALAQSEYYYDGEEDRDEWAFHMYWRARFRRVRLGGAVSAIPGLSAATSVIDRIIVH